MLVSTVSGDLRGGERHRSCGVFSISAIITMMCSSDFVLHFASGRCLPLLLVARRDIEHRCVYPQLERLYGAARED